MEQLLLRLEVEGTVYFLKNGLVQDKILLRICLITTLRHQNNIVVAASLRTHMSQLCQARLRVKY